MKRKITRLARTGSGPLRGASGEARAPCCASTRPRSASIPKPAPSPRRSSRRPGTWQEQRGSCMASIHVEELVRGAQRAAQGLEGAQARVAAAGVVRDVIGQVGLRARPLELARQPLVGAQPELVEPASIEQRAREGLALAD